METTFDFTILTYSPWAWLALIGIVAIAVTLYVVFEVQYQRTAVAEPVEREADYTPASEHDVRVTVIHP